MQRGSVFRLAGLALIWGSSFLLIALGLRGFAPIQIVFGRLLFGAGVLLLFVLFTRRSLPRDPMLWLHLGVVSVIANVVPFLLFAVGETEVSSGIAGVLNATTPLWTLLVGYASGHDRRVTALRLAGVVLGFVGVLLIFSPWRSGSEAASWGGLACLTAAALYGVTFIYMDRFIVRRGVESVVLSASQLAVGTLLTLPLLPFLGGLRAPHWHWAPFLAVATLGAVGTGVAYVLNYRLVADEGPTASVVTYLLPVVAVLLGFLLLGEPLSLQVIGGMAIVLIAVSLVRRPTVPAVQTSTNRA
ncbi:DMT family transporter [Longispora fulva]|uniref:Drug/metabolite transporter (DMT)-like permease n=1 Tax=Longispora fulva TaxID=619741 RepID=A0A8J7GH80_9ACTN|nr:DMT family transporter [Longispora fulva]MBG6140643.1 drug/metabolite transporter (DMT)-like permease [Longispora fulva]